MQGSRVNQEGCHGRCPLHEAARLGKASLVKMLLDAGARVDPRSHYGLTPLALAAQGGHLEVVQTLLRKGQRAEHWVNSKITRDGQSVCGSATVSAV